MVFAHCPNNTKQIKGKHKFQPPPRKKIVKKARKKKNKSKAPPLQHLPLAARIDYPILRLHREIEEFYQEAKPAPLEHSIRDDVVRRLTALVHQRWPYAKVETFGSFRTGLYLPNGDIDVVIFGRWQSLPIKTFAEQLTRSSFPEPTSIRVLDHASVPIIKVVDRLTKIKVDICFNVAGGLACADFINEHIEKLPALPRLALVLKQFLAQRGLGEVYHGGLSSFSLLLMVVSLLQMSPLRAANNYAVLLMEFLQLYGLQFNYTKAGIDVTGKGKYYPRPSQSQNCPLHIQDPINDDHNVGKSSFGAPTVKNAFAQGYIQLFRILSSSEPLPSEERILDKIAKLPDSVHQFRSRLTKMFPKAAHQA